ncbi:hypothetical protein FHG87_005808 [Trinorchestia longiramus]|nr:hypothetical protein FHG87_005808 [Trinorchestia longiramus]
MQSLPPPPALFLILSLTPRAPLSLSHSLSFSLSIYLSLSLSLSRHEWTSARMNGCGGGRAAMMSAQSASLSSTSLHTRLALHTCLLCTAHTVSAQCTCFALCTQCLYTVHSAVFILSVRQKLNFR